MRASDDEHKADAAALLDPASLERAHGPVTEHLLQQCSKSFIQAAVTCPPSKAVIQKMTAERQKMGDMWKRFAEDGKPGGAVARYPSWRKPAGARESGREGTADMPCAHNTADHAVDDENEAACWRNIERQHLWIATTKAQAQSSGCEGEEKFVLGCTKCTSDAGAKGCETNCPEHKQVLKLDEDGLKIRRAAGGQYVVNMDPADVALAYENGDLTVEVRTGFGSTNLIGINVILKEKYFAGKQLHFWCPEHKWTGHTEYAAQTGTSNSELYIYTFEKGQDCDSVMKDHYLKFHRTLKGLSSQVSPLTPLDPGTGVHLYSTRGGQLEKFQMIYVPKNDQPWPHSWSNLFTAFHAKAKDIGFRTVKQRTITLYREDIASFGCAIGDDGCKKENGERDPEGVLRYLTLAHDGPPMGVDITGNNGYTFLSKEAREKLYKLIYPDNPSGSWEVKGAFAYATLVSSVTLIGQLVGNYGEGDRAAAWSRSFDPPAHSVMKITDLDAPVEDSTTGETADQDKPDQNRESFGTNLQVFDAAIGSAPNELAGVLLSAGQCAAGIAAAAASTGVLVGAALSSCGPLLVKTFDYIAELVTFTVEEVKIDPALLVEIGFAKQYVDELRALLASHVVQERLKATPVEFDPPVPLYTSCAQIDPLKHIKHAEHNYITHDGKEALLTANYVSFDEEEDSDPLDFTLGGTVEEIDDQTAQQYGVTCNKIIQCPEFPDEFRDEFSATDVCIQMAPEFHGAMWAQANPSQTKR